ncbi:MBL fold metallo-hydrolase [Paenibacillus validus]|uniref:MBL fold metallo-hydrolase n=1 Tax=Paenibacillus TaxID=44249 RepID=UPI000FDA05F4|nr:MULTISPECIES: MBL fold metallo-hydrolase [Paenibacillus]MED4600646.1 MBL fold metallo-hydrolase [Paenibacillus validus]MED4605285.1 MBL fold metallo-hydrolase [Paenibacillus validus]
MDAGPEDMLYMRTLIANVVFVGEPGSDDWVLVDAGVYTFADNIADTAKKRFRSVQPRAIVLTHGHFDHVGSLADLLELWDVPVYAHEKELPYLTGKADYPEPDPTVGGGLMSQISPLYPRKGIDIGERAQALPDDGSIPVMPGWQWIHTPGHTEGHVSLFRESDRTLIAGDAFITVKQESALAVITQRAEIHGPPAYFTVEWDKAWASVKRLEALKPLFAVTGHGIPMFGEELEQGLARLARDFDKLAIPEHGRYVHHPAEV